MSRVRTSLTRSGSLTTLTLLAGLAMEPPGHAGTPLKIWTWGAPCWLPNPYCDDGGDPCDPTCSPPTNSAYIKPMVRVHVDGIDTGNMADLIADPGRSHLYGRSIAAQISTYGLGEGDIVINLQNFGSRIYADFVLAGHTGDAITDPGVSCADLTCPGDPTPIPTDFRLSPWLYSGVGECETWVEEFITQYKAEMLEDPYAFYMDVEDTSYGPCCCSSSHEERLCALQLDARWDSAGASAVMYGFSGDTLADLWVEAGSPTIDDADGQTVPMQSLSMGEYTVPPANGNQNWNRWYYGLAFQSLDAALKVCLYDKVRDGMDGWGSGVHVSNYHSSMRIDETHHYRALSRDGAIQDGGDPSYPYRWVGSATKQSPVLYDADYEHQITFGAPSIWDATLLAARHNLDACIDSFSGGHAGEVVPWIPMNGFGVPNFEDARESPPIRPFISIGDEQRLLSLLRSKAITEALLWYGSAPTDTQWSNFNLILSEVYKYDLSAVVQGPSCGETSLVAKGTLSDHSAMTLDRSCSSSQYYRAADCTFLRTTSGDPTNVRFNLEAVCVNATSIPFIIKARNVSSGNWITVGSGLSVSELLPSTGGVYSCVFAAGDYINNSNPSVPIIEVRALFDFTGQDISAAVHLDLAQLVANDAEYLDGDSAPSPWERTVRRLNTIVGLLGTRGQNLAGDLNGDGMVDPLDVRAALLNFIDR